LDREQLKKMAEDPRLISGIYNYCDRWCERCNFTSRCMNFAMAETENLSPEELDINNEAFWKKMGEIFAFTRELIELSAGEMGIDLDSFDEKETENERRSFEEAKDHVITKMAADYADKAREWLDNSEGILKEKENELLSRVNLGIEVNKIDEEALTIKDALEVIAFYLFFIQVKVMRALHGKIEGVPEIIEDMPKDSDGSAKIAMISIERSISAWGIMLQNFTEDEDYILNILVLLKRLYNNVMNEFPEAMSFVRPGFDE